MAAVARMTKCQIGSVVVVERRHPLGVITERDVLAQLTSGHADPLRIAVREMLPPELVVVEPATSIAEALALASARRQRHLPVVDGDELCGLVSLGDLTAWLVRDHEQTIRDLHDYITH
jgi:CBS domain-containing protein